MRSWNWARDVQVNSLRAIRCFAQPFTTRMYYYYLSLTLLPFGREHECFQHNGDRMASAQRPNTIQPLTHAHYNHVFQTGWVLVISPTQEHTRPLWPKGRWWCNSRQEKVPESIIVCCLSSECSGWQVRTHVLRTAISLLTYSLTVLRYISTSESLCTNIQ